MRWLRYLVIVGALCAALPRAAQAGGTPAGPNVQVTDAGLANVDDATTPEIAAQAGALYAAWSDTRAGTSTERPVYFARSDDGGASWSANKRASLLSYTGFTDRPVISVAPDGSIWIAWWLNQCYAISGACGGVDRQNDTRLALSTDGGQTFGEYLALDGDDAGADIDSFVEIHAENDRTFILTNNPAGAGVDVLLRVVNRSGPGLLQARTVRLSEGSGSGRLTDNIIPDGPRMSLAARGGTICAAWEDTRARFAIYGACSADAGATFGANFQISGSDDFNPRLAIAPDGTLYAAYQDVAGGPVLLRRSGDRGASWGAPSQAFGLASGQRIGSYDLDVDAGGQILLTTAVETGSSSNKTSDLFLATSVDRGQRFALSGPLEDGQGQYPSIATQTNPRTAVGGGPGGQHAFVIWSDDRNVQDQIWSTRADLDSTPPSAPANLRAQAGDTSILLTWDAASDASGVAGYHVLRASSAAGPYSRITPGPVAALGYRDVGLSAATYFYRVYAVDRTGNPGPESNTASAAAAVGGGLAGLRGTIAYEAGASLALRGFGGAGLGAERLVGQSGLPAFSHDGQRILSLSAAAGKSSVISQRLDGGDRRVIYTADSLISSLDTASDPNYIGGAFLQQYYAPALCQAFEPRIVSLQPPQQVAGVTAALATDIAITSDHAMIAYTYRNWCNGVGVGVYDTPRLCLQNVATQQESCLDGASAEDSDFVPNRASIVFSADLTGQREIWLADVLPNGALRNLTQLTRGPAGQPSLGPRASTDGSWVIFERDVDPGPGEQRVLHVVRLDGDGLRSLGVAGTTPAWSGGGPAPSFIPGSNRTMLPLLRR